MPAPASSARTRGRSSSNGSSLRDREPERERHQATAVEHLQPRLGLRQRLGRAVLADPDRVALVDAELAELAERHRQVEDHARLERARVVDPEEEAQELDPGARVADADRVAEVVVEHDAGQDRLDDLAGRLRDVGRRHAGARGVEDRLDGPGARIRDPCLLRRSACPRIAVRMSGPVYFFTSPVTSRKTVSPAWIVRPLNELWAEPAR